MQNDRFSVGWMLFIVTASGVYAWIAKLAFDGSPLATLVASSVLVGLFPFAIYAFAFLLVYPLGVLNVILGKGTEEAKSPFANERLPTQQVVPEADPEKAH